MPRRSDPVTYNGDSRATSGGVNHALDAARGRHRRAKGCEAVAHAIRMPRGQDHAARTARQVREQAEATLRDRLGGHPIEPWHYLQLDRVYHCAVGLMVGYAKLSEIGYLRERLEVKTISKSSAGRTQSLRVEDVPTFHPLAKDIDRLHNQMADAYRKLGIDQTHEKDLGFLNEPHQPDPTPPDAAQATQTHEGVSDVAHGEACSTDDSEGLSST